LIHFYKRREDQESFEGRNSWKWQSKVSQNSSLESSNNQLFSEEESSSYLGSVTRDSYLDSNTITRTTTYDSKSGGFVTSVSTDKNTHDDDDNCENSENQRHELGEDGEKLVLTQDTYNTLKRSEKKTVSFKSNNNTMKRKMSSDDLKSGLVYRSPEFVKSIKIVNKHGRLIKLEQKDKTTKEDSSDDSITNDNDVAVVNHDDENKYHVMTNSNYVANISFSKDSSDRKTSNADSLVTNSLLVLTAPRFRKEEDEKAKLSGYILDENSNENSFDQQQDSSSSKNGSSQIFPSAILDTNDELTNLYKTISRKQILSKVQHSSFNLNTTDNMRENAAPPPSSRPLAKILSMLHSVPNNENMYTSIAEDSVYQSLPTQTSNENKSDQTNSESFNNNSNEVITACPVLLTNILATHTETFRHAYDTGCEDCFDYSNSIGYALPYLQSKQMDSSSTCKVHKGPFKLPHIDPERGHIVGRYANRSNERNKNARLICYLTGILLAFLVLIGVIVVLTLMVANKEFGIIKEIDF